MPSSTFLAASFSFMARSAYRGRDRVVVVTLNEPEVPDEPDEPVDPDDPFEPVDPDAEPDED